jgi:guanylate kinase
VLIFIAPPDVNTLLERLGKRATESREQINERDKKGRLEMGKANEFDYIVVNDKLENAHQKFKK